MDLYKTGMSLIPDQWKPYVGAALIILYLVTKVRSMFKSQQLNQVVAQKGFDVTKKPTLSKVIDFIF